jgi:hypothetical protein
MEQTKIWKENNSMATREQRPGQRASTTQPHPCATLGTRKRVDVTLFCSEICICCFNQTKYIASTWVLSPVFSTSTLRVIIPKREKKKKKKKKGVLGYRILEIKYDFDSIFFQKQIIFYSIFLKKSNLEIRIQNKNLILISKIQHPNALFRVRFELY